MIPRIYADKEMTQLLKEYATFAPDGDRISVLNITDSGYFTLTFEYGYNTIEFNKLFVALGTYTLADYVEHQEQNYSFSLKSKNLFELTPATISEGTKIGDLSNGYWCKGNTSSTTGEYAYSKGWLTLPFDFEANKNYVLSFDVKQITAGYTDKIALRYEDTASNLLEITLTDTFQRYNVQLAPTTNKKVYIALSSNEIQITDIQVEVGSTATDYEPYYDIRAMQGTQLLDDGIHQKHKQIVLDGTETFWNITMAGDIPCFWFKNSDFGAKNNPHNKKCNYFIYSSLGFRNAEINTLCENESTIPLFIFKTNIANSVETWKQLLAQRYANGTPVIVEYELEEEEIIPYNSTQQAQYNAIKQARSYDDMTIISSTSDELGFNMNAVGLEKSVNQVLGGSY